VRFAITGSTFNPVRYLGPMYRLDTSRRYVSVVCTARGHHAVMASNPAAPVPNPVQIRDATILIGILAILEGRIWAGQLDEGTTSKVAERYVQQGLLGADHDQHDLRQAIGDMNQRIRYAAGEYDTAPPSIPLPP
jgi:hypothetical protein